MYPEVGWIAIESLTVNFPPNPTLSSESFIYITGMKNPPYCANVNGGLLVITVDMF